ncbi:MAG: hypothetical protein PHS95_01115 [Candidatus Pacebacteria bacterium]|nr:hypothetical protein [Candidatus Paceibacterota bacterium]
MKKNKTKTLFFVALAVMVISGGVYAFFFVAMKDKIGSITDLSIKAEELSGSEFQKVSSAYAVSIESANIEKLSTYDIKESDIVEFTKKIESLGPDSSTELSIESLDQQTGQNGEPVLVFRLKASGKFQDVMRLILLLENYPAQFEWAGVELAREDKMFTEVDSKGVSKVVAGPTKWKVRISLVVLNFIKA